jgi:hypothetical protein
MGPRSNRVKLISASEIDRLPAKDATENALEGHAKQTYQEFFSNGELACRWRISRGTVYNRLRSIGAKVLDFAASGKRGKKAVSAAVIRQIESRKTKRLA